MFIMSSLLEKHQGSTSGKCDEDENREDQQEGVGRLYAPAEACGDVVEDRRIPGRSSHRTEFTVAAAAGGAPAIS